MLLKKSNFLKNLKIKKCQKNLYPLSKPPPKFEKILVIGGLDKGFYGNTIYSMLLLSDCEINLRTKNCWFK